MRRSLLSGWLIACVLLIAASSRSDTPALPPADALQEPTTSAPATPAPGGETTVKDPFSPYDVGPPEAITPYEALSSEEQQLADRGRDTTGWDAIHQAYNRATTLRAQQAAAASAAAQLGLVNSLAGTGVVP